MSRRLQGTRAKMIGHPRIKALPPASAVLPTVMHMAGRSKHLRLKGQECALLDCCRSTIG
jgi:hypothetical protein